MTLRKVWVAGFARSLLLGWTGHFSSPFHPIPMCSQNLVLPDTFFSFYDLRREFHMQHPNTCPARDLTVGTMAQGTCDPAELRWRGGYLPKHVHAAVWVILM